MKENFFNESIAASYDLDTEMFDPAVVEPVVDFLAELAGDGGALEFGIGTGRIALPLTRRGVRVHGIDLSAPMVERLRAKEGAEGIETTIGDFASTRVNGTFRLVYLVYNGICNLTTQSEQVDCFKNAALHLEPGGSFVVEVIVPALRRLPPGETVHPFAVGPTHLGFDEYDTATQSAVSHHYWVLDGEPRVWSTPWRYVWPSELDLMGNLAGLRLRERWESWTREPFTPESQQHISVWSKS